VSDDTTLGAFRADAAAPTAEDELLRQDLRRSLRRALNSLSQRQRTVIALRYGLTDRRGQTLDEIGRRLGSAASGCGSSRTRHSIGFDAEESWPPGMLPS
jgi:DNA-directed RNA polymerase sigma subunit (sigma70/sigma32)